MTCNVICMASAKGGSGKTVLTATLAAFLFEIGKSVLIVDCDESTNGMSLLYLESINSIKSSQEKYVGLFDDHTKLKYSKIKISGGIDFIPATFELIANKTVEELQFKNRIFNIVSDERENYDYIFLDSQAGLDTVSKVTMNSKVSDQVIIVSEYDPLSTAGVERLKAVMGGHLDSTRTWVLLNKMLPEFVASFTEFLSVARYLPPIPWSAEVVRAYSKRRLAVDFEYGNEFTLAVMQTLKSLLPESEVLELEEWAKNRAHTLREPIKTQLADVEEKMKILIERKNNLGIQYARYKMFKVIPGTLGIMYGGIIFLEIFLFEKSPSILIDTFGMLFFIPIVLLFAITLVIYMHPYFRNLITRYDFEQSRLDIELKNTEKLFGKLSILQDASLEEIVRENRG